MYGMMPRAAIAAKGINPALLGAGALGVGAAAYGASQMMGGGDPYGAIADPAEAAMQRQVQQSVAVAEDAGRFKADLERAAAAQAYNQQRGLAGQQINAAAATQANQLRAEQAAQVLNAHLQANAQANAAASNIAGNRFY